MANKELQSILVKFFLDNHAGNLLAKHLGIPKKKIMDELKNNIPKGHCMYMTFLVRCESKLLKHNLMTDFIQILANLILNGE